MEQFPGRTLEELDDIDWGRLMRAKEAEHVRNVEELRLQHMAGKIEADKIQPDEWAAFKEHLEILSRYD